MRTLMLLTSGERSFSTRRNSRWLTGKVTYIGSWLTMVVRTPLSGPTTLPFVTVGTPDLAGNWRNDVGIAEIDLRRLQVGLIGHDGPLALALGCNSFVQLLACAYVFRKQLFLPFAVLPSELVLRFACLQRALRLLDRGLEQAFFDAIERVALLDQIALLEQDRVQVALYPRPDLHAIDCVDAADKIERLRNRLPLRNGDADRNGVRRTLLR